MSKKRKASAQLTISDLFSKKRKDIEDEGECALTPTSSLSADSVDKTACPSVIAVDDEPQAVDVPSSASAASASGTPAAAESAPVVPNDIGEGFDCAEVCWEKHPSSLSDKGKMDLIVHPFIPGPSFKFPVHAGADGRNRKFQLDWLKKNSWLVYSAKCDGGFCVPCLLFPSGARQGQLTASPMTNFKKATTLLEKHSQQRSHLDAMAKLGQFQAVYVSGKADVAAQLLDVHQTQAKENEQKLKSIIDCIIFCGKQNISLRGHRNEVLNLQNSEDDSANGEETLITLVRKEDGNPGNFIALLEFRAQAGDKAVVRDFHVSSASGSGGRKITYCSPKSQNEIIECCGDYISEAVLSRVRKAPFFSVLADEATDCGNLEQMPVVVRFVEDYGVKEEFLGFVTCDTGVTGNALAMKVKDAVLQWNLDPQKWRGQGYDGAANMAGRMNGCAAIIQRDYPKAIYYHCSAHALNLCVMSMSQISQVSNMWTVLRQVSLFFENSPKQQQKLEDVIKETPNEVLNDSARKKLVSLCRTRWVQRHCALVTFADLYSAVVDTLETISEDRQHWNADSVQMAFSLLKSITDFLFIATFTITSNIMAYIQGLSIGLQEKSLDVCQAYSHITTTQATLEKARETVDVKHNIWWREAVDMADGVGVQPSAPRTCRRQRDRDNVPATTPEVYFRRAVSIKLLEELIGQFEQRFGPLQQKIGDGMKLLPALLLSDPPQAKEAILKFADDWADDLPSGSSIRTFRAELDIWHTALSKYPADKLPASLVQSAKLAGELLCPGVAQMLVLLATFPVTTCTCERSISSLRRLKTYMRSTMGAERLSGLALLHTHYSMHIDRDDILKRFFMKTPRRILSSFRE